MKASGGHHAKSCGHLRWIGKAGSDFFSLICGNLRHLRIKKFIHRLRRFTQMKASGGHHAKSCSHLRWIGKAGSDFFSLICGNLRHLRIKNIHPQITQIYADEDQSPVQAICG